MGLDFIRRTKTAFRKAWRNGWEELSTPNLLNRDAIPIRRSVQATVVDPTVFEGEELLASRDGERLVLMRALTRVGCVDKPPPDILASLSESSGVLKATVDRLNSLSSTMEVRL